MTWDEIRGTPLYRKRWLALDNCHYDDASPEPVEADVVDSDEDLSELCQRLSVSNLTRCAIVFCDDSEPEPLHGEPPMRLPERRKYLRAS